MGSRASAVMFATAPHFPMIACLFLSKRHLGPLILLLHTYVGEMLHGCGTPARATRDCIDLIPFSIFALHKSGVWGVPHDTERMSRCPVSRSKWLKML